MLTVEAAEARVVGLRTRIPFRYGIAEMTVTPHAVVRVRIAEGGAVTEGFAGEHLPPKWFTKDPSTSYEADLPHLVESVRAACDAAAALGPQPSPFALWQALDDVQRAWARDARIPGLLAGLGVSLVERAVIDAACRAGGVPFVEALQRGALGVDLGAVHPELAGSSVADHLPATVAPRLAVRHTVGLGDPLTRAAAAGDDPGDGLPVSLEEVVEADGIDHLKVKIGGDPDADADQLRRVVDLVGDRIALVTLDGNERFRSAQELSAHWDGLRRDAEVARFLDAALLAVEQPFHRDAAFGADVRELLSTRRDLPPVIIDESDAETSSVRDALDLGYAGGTYKGCKGVFRGIANACLVEARGRTRRTVLTAEDLSTVPPLAFTQDLVVAACLGLGHIERNGHHYFARPAPVTDGISARLAAAHPDCFALGADGVARVRIAAGRIEVGSLLEAPFGLAVPLDLSSLDLLTPDTALAVVTG